MYAGINKIDLAKDTVYTHPTAKVCNYSYTHPTTKQCSWVPDIPMKLVGTYTSTTTISFPTYYVFMLVGKSSDRGGATVSSSNSDTMVICRQGDLYTSGVSIVARYGNTNDRFVFFTMNDNNDVYYSSGYLSGTSTLRISGSTTIVKVYGII